MKRAWINWETEIHTHGALCMDLHTGKPKLGLILRTPTKWEPKQDTKPNEQVHRTKWESRGPRIRGIWEELNSYAEWSREFAGEQHWSQGGNIASIKSPYPQTHGNGGARH